MKNLINRALMAEKKYIFALTAVVGLVMMSCTEPAYINSPGDNSKNYDSIPITIPDTNGVEVSIAEALEICKGLANDQVTEELYKVRGVLAGVSTDLSKIPSQYTNINFTLKDPNSQDAITCFYTNNLNNRPFYKASDVPAAGKKVTVLGPLTKYKDTPELKNGFIVKIED